MTVRLLRWLFTNVLIALIPLGVSLQLHIFSGRLPDAQWVTCPELLFFSMMMTVTALGDLSDIIPDVGITSPVMLGCGTLGFGALWSAIMYGVFLDRSLSQMPDKNFEHGFFMHAIVVAVIALFVSATTEICVSASLTSEE